MGRYAIFNGLIYGGGTNVIPNPEGTPTEELHSLQIGNDIYEIVGGGGSGEGYSETLLYKYEKGTTVDGIKTLNDDITNYDLLLFRLVFNVPTYTDHIISVSALEQVGYISNPVATGPHVSIVSYASDYIRIVEGETKNKINIFEINGNEYINEIYGIKLEGGSGSGSGNATLDATTLYDTPITATGTYTLADDYNNYDFIGFKAGNGSTETDIRLYAVKDIQDSMNDNLVITNNVTNSWFNFTISENKLTIPGKTVSTIYSVIGYKIKGGGGSGGASAIEKTLSEYNALTPAEKTNGAIYMVSNDGRDTDTPLNMSNITVFRESNTNATSSVDETVVSWDGGSQIGLNYYYTAPVDVTGVKSIKYNLTTGSCYGGGAEAQRESWRFYVGVTSEPITSFKYDTSKMLVFNEYRLSNTTYTDKQCTLDVSEISGFVYLTVFAHGWNATLTNVVISKAGESVNKIYYMGTEYANTNGGSGGGGDGYKIEKIFDGNVTTAGNITLTKSLNNYDELLFVTNFTSVLGESYIRTFNVDVSIFKNIGSYTATRGVLLNDWSRDTRYAQVKYVDNTTINVDAIQVVSIVEIYGVKHSGGSSSGSSKVEYSTNEHVVGTWIDGRDVYEKTIYKDSISGKGNFLIANYPTKNDIDFIAVQDVCYIVNNNYINGIGICLETGANAQGVFLDNNNAPSGFPTNFTDIYVTIRYVKKAVS